MIKENWKIIYEEEEDKKIFQQRKREKPGARKA
jgi:hypothetical protein